MTVLRAPATWKMPNLLRQVVAVLRVHPSPGALAVDQGGETLVNEASSLDSVEEGGGRHWDLLLIETYDKAVNAFPAVGYTNFHPASGGRGVDDFLLRAGQELVHALLELAGNRDGVDFGWNFPRLLCLETS
jgi:hypothetical protein